MPTACATNMELLRKGKLISTIMDRTFWGGRPKSITHEVYFNFFHGIKWGNKTLQYWKSSLNKFSKQWYHLCLTKSQIKACHGRYMFLQISCEALQSQTQRIMHLTLCSMKWNCEVAKCDSLWLCITVQCEGLHYIKFKDAAGANKLINSVLIILQHSFSANTHRKFQTLRKCVL